MVNNIKLVKQYRFLFLLFLLAFLISCYEDNCLDIEMLTPKTMEGKETLSFLKDGEVWVASKDALSPIAIIRSNSKQFVVQTRKKWGDNYKESFSWGFPLEDYEPRKYYGSLDSFFFLNAKFFPEADLNIYCLSQDGYGGNSLGLDTFNYVDINHIDFSGTFNIISGTFQFRLINTVPNECQDTLWITDGRFDLELDVQ